MLKFKKLIAVTLALVICFTLASVMSVSAESTTVVKMNVSLNPESNVSNVSIATNQRVGAISGTLTWTGTATYNADDSKVNECVATNDAVVKAEEENKLKFVIVTDNLNGTDDGDFAWAVFNFTGIDGNVTFKLDNVKVADVGATKLETPAKVEGGIAKLGEMFTQLGSQYRAENGSTSAAIRFATKIYADPETGAFTGGVAIQFGCLVGYKNNILEKNDVSEINLADGTWASWNAEKGTLAASKVGVLKAVATKYYASGEDSDGADWIAARFAIEGISEDNKGKDIVYCPYLIYKDKEGKYQIQYGEQIIRDYNTVEALTNIVAD